MEALLRNLNRLDWVLATLCLGYGAATLDWRFALAGLISLGVAWYNPSSRVKKALEKRLLASPKRRQEQAARASAVRIAEEEAAYSQAQTQQALAAKPADYRPRAFGYGPTMLGASKHNQLRAGAMNLAGKAQKTWY